MPWASLWASGRRSLPGIEFIINEQCYQTGTQTCKRELDAWLKPDRSEDKRSWTSPYEWHCIFYKGVTMPADQWQSWIMARPDADVMGQPVSQRELTADIPYWIDVYCLVSSFTCSEMTDGQERVSHPILERLLVNNGCSCDLRSDTSLWANAKEKEEEYLSSSHGY